MLTALLRLDQGLARARPTWIWLGQLALVVLGVHLAADQLDDVIYDGLVALGLPWPTTDWPVWLAQWVAVLTELAVAIWAMGVLIRGIAVKVTSFAEWRQRVTVGALVRPVFWVPVSLAGAWVVGMSVEDAFASWSADGAHYAAFVVAGVAVWRLALPSWRDVLLALPRDGHRLDGWWWAPVPLGVAVLAALYGLPIWGLFQ